MENILLHPVRMPGRRVELAEHFDNV